MPVVFTPYLERVADAVSDDAEPADRRGGEPSGPSKWSVAVGAAVAGVAAALAARRLKRVRAGEARRERESERADESAGKLRRVGKGWIRR